MQTLQNTHNILILSVRANELVFTLSLRPHLYYNRINYQLNNTVLILHHHQKFVTFSTFKAMHTELPRLAGCLSFLCRFWPTVQDKFTVKVLKSNII
jgi:hypothetical protein